jgi:hypothetical protein
MRGNFVRNIPVRQAAVVLVFFCCAYAAHAQKIKSVRDPETAHILRIKKATNLPDGDLAEKIEKYTTGKTTLTESPDKIRQAFVFCVPSGNPEATSCAQRVFITDLGTDETYEITGEDVFAETGRLISELKWINNFTLSYERWMQPHYGHRYVIDFKLKKQTASFALTDR